MTAKGHPAANLSIGDLAEASGIAPDTLRVWERRYGKPEPVRLPSGHRRYRADDVPWLRRVAEALARGHRPGSVLSLGARQLDALLAGEAGDPGRPAVEALLRSVKRFRGGALQRALQKDARRMGPRRFLRERVAPLLELAGREWADGRLEVRHEHWLSEILEDVLRGLRRGAVPPAGARDAVLATLPGEHHGLGLQMAAVTCVLAGVRPHVIGIDTPLDDIAAAAREFGADAVLVSVSVATGGVATDRVLADLRGRIPPAVALVAGGGGIRGPRRGPRGVVLVRGLDGLEEWLAREMAPRA